MLSVLAAIDEALDVLLPSSRARRSYGCSFEIDIASNHTLGELGTRFHLTREPIRQIESRAMRKLMHPGRTDKPGQFPRPLSRGHHRSGTARFLARTEAGVPRCASYVIAEQVMARRHRLTGGLPAAIAPAPSVRPVDPSVPYLPVS
ncbi:sigma factor-like helix-turn-helix DNA-binding protein [Paraburkholderia sp. BR13439]|uniref:sigma factor-like helix-turn-helix DNA-binding protein n=1 Tax=unclassified Paraburkholderia TaxID=2615204 RepID=UPI0034D00557